MLFFLAGSLAVHFAPDGGAVFEQNPQQAVANFLEAVRRLDFPVKDPEEHRELLTQANAYLDLESMGQKALEAHWNQATAEEQQAFLALLWKLIENMAYPRSQRFMGNYEIAYPEVRSSGDGFDVFSVIRQDEEALDAKVVYHVSQKDRGWKIDDVILDDVSIIEDLKLQFDKIISQSRFPGLLEKMREKLAAAEKENQSTLG